MLNISYIYKSHIKAINSVESKLVKYWQFHMVQPVLQIVTGKKALESICTNVLQDDEKHGDDTILDRYKKCYWIFCISKIIAIYVRELKMLEII